MSYDRLKRTFFFLVTLSASTLAAQTDDPWGHLDQLSSPFAHEREDARHRLATLEGDLSVFLERAYGGCDLEEQLGLLEVAALRKDPSLAQEAAAELASDNDRLCEASRHYLMELGDAAEVDTAKLTVEAAAEWLRFRDWTIRYRISLALLDSQLKPGKYSGQFDGLRQSQPETLDRLLVDFVLLDPEFAGPVRDAGLKMQASEVTIEMQRSAAWTRMKSARAFADAWAILRDPSNRELLADGTARNGSRMLSMAFGMIQDLRVAAVRALGDSSYGEVLQPMLREIYYSLAESRSPEQAKLASMDSLLVEIELALARFGSDELLNSRIAFLRSQYESGGVDQAETQGSANAALRTEQAAGVGGLRARNQVALLLLHSGDARGAEEEWQVAVETIEKALPHVGSRERNSLSAIVGAVYYNLACAQSLQLKSGKALESLKKAVEHGYADYAWMLEDGDLENLRSSNGFRRWFADHAPPSIADRLEG